MRVHRLAATSVAAVIGTLIVTIPTPAVGVSAGQSAVVNAVPASYTPDVNDGTVFAIGQSGSTVVIGGSFDSISPHGSSSTSYPVTNLAAFTAGTGDLVTSFAPTTNGQVNAIIAGPAPGTVYVGGDFTTIDGVNSKVALINTTTGAMVPGWKSPAINGHVNTLASYGGQLYVGGLFTSVSNNSRVGLAVLNGNTGALNTAYTTPTFTGHHNYGRLCNPSTTKCANAGTGVTALDISPDGMRLVAIGNFTSVSGQADDQIALVDLGATSATVDPNWSTDAYTAECAGNAFDSYVRDVQFSPDGVYFVVAVTGGGGVTGHNSDGTQTSCDTAARFETSGTGSDVRPTWIDYTGNDTFLSVAITGAAVYIGGHERWVNNSTGSDRAAEGAVPRPGIVALDPINGMPLSWNPGRNPRGTGAHALLATSDGLYVGSDTDYIGDRKYLHKEIAFFPLAGGETLAANQVGSLPGTVYLLGSGTNSSTAQSVSWDGSSAPGSPSPVTSVDWSTTRAAFEIDGNVYTASTDGNFYERPFNGTTFGAPVAIDPYDDPTWSNVSTGSGQTFRGVKSSFYGEMSSLTSMFYTNGRVYYTRSGNSHMFWRWFEPDSGVMGSQEFTTTDPINWSHVAGAFLSGSTLYFADSTSRALFSVPFTIQANGTPALANNSINWTSHGAFVFLPPPNQPPTASFLTDCTLLTCSVDASNSSDPEGGIASYVWDWGDGSTSQDSAPTDSHSYGSDGSYTVTLTVTDGGGATDTTTQKVNVASAPITFEGVTTYDGNGSSATLTEPAMIQAGDQLLLFESWASTATTSPVPAGWTQVGTFSKTNLTTAVLARTADSTDVGGSVPVTFSAPVKASLTLADYSGASGEIEALSSGFDVSKSSHTSPAVSGLSDESLALTFWTDKSTGTTSWTPPVGVSQESAVFGTGGGAVSALLADSGGAISGSYGGLTALTNATSGVAVEWTVALAAN